MTAQSKAAAAGAGIGAVLLAITWAIEANVPFVTAGVALDGKLTQVQAKQLDLVVDLAKLFINWSFAVIGANGFFLKGVAESKMQLRLFELYIAEIAIVTALFSVLYGQLAISNVVRLLQLDQFDASNPLINGYVTRAFWMLVASVIATIVFAYHYFNGRESARRIQAG